MAKSLKQKNQPQLITFSICNAIVLAALATGFPRLVDLFSQLTNRDWTALGKLIALPAFVSLVTGILGWAMPGVMKELLVFWRIGPTCLPSSRAFTILGPHDPRVDMSRLIAKYGRLPTFPTEQTALWYRLYRTHREEASIDDAHGAYLRYREMTALIGVFVGVELACALYFHIFGTRLVSGTAILIIEYLIVMFAARNAAAHFVTNVLAVESALSPA